MKKKIAHFGAFDHDSYGDLILPWIAEHFLGPEFEVVHVAPTDFPTPWPDAKPIISIQDAINRDDWDGVLIGGGDIVQAGDWVPEKWRTDEVLSIAALPGLWIGASLLAARLNIPLAWNAPGVPNHPSPEFIQTARLALQSADYVSVRDSRSREILSVYTDTSIQVIPDSAILINEVWARPLTHENPSQFVISLSVSDLQSKLDEITDALCQVYTCGEANVPIEVLPLMAWQQEGNALETPFACQGMVEVLSRPLTLQECVDKIAYSRGYVGNSLHGFITAVSYGVPAVLVVPGNSDHAHKYTGFLRAIGHDPRCSVVKSWRDAIVGLRERRALKLKKKIGTDQRKHWQTIQDVFRAPSRTKNIIWNELVSLASASATQSAAFGVLPEALFRKYFLAMRAREELLQTLDSLTEDSNGQIASLNQTLVERNGQIVNLKETFTERERRNADQLAVLANKLAQETSDSAEEIASLGRVVTDRDEQIANLNEVLVELGAKSADQLAVLAGRLAQETSDSAEEIASLGRVVTERDEQIANLNEVLIEQKQRSADQLAAMINKLAQEATQRAEECASLNQTVSERDSQIVDLNLTVAERDSQIASLNHALAKRDGSIIGLTDETVRRGEWALRLGAELKEEHARLLRMTQSNSWRLTLPLREARRWVSAPGQQIKKYARSSLHLAKRIYQSLPLRYQTKTAHRYYLAKYAPGILRASNGLPRAVPAVRIRKATVGPMIDMGSPSRGISLPTSLQPLVSVIIPVFGKCDYTLRCLNSIVENPPTTPFEVIVVDDCSLDNSAEVLRGVEGIKLISNPENLGFIRACNVGVKAASGQYLLFLNNDTEVTHGWMDELIRTFHEFPGTGLVGSKLLYPDGTLQEAGGIIWQDGSAWNFGRNQDPSLPIYNYAREVDYCSGASIMVPKALFEYLGGFDEHYLPAYCEDTDLALKIRDRGYRVIYQPLSVVVHYEGITSGTDTTQGAKAYQVENLKKQFHRWKERLATHQAPGLDLENAKDRTAKRRVLVVDHCTPTPNQDAGSILAFNLLILLREMGFQVTFIPEDNFLYMPDYTPTLQRAGMEVLYAPYYTSVEQHIKESGGRYDLIFLIRPMVVERHLKSIRKYCVKAKVIFHTVDLHYLRMSREAGLHGDMKKQESADQMKQRELAVMREVDATIVVSTTELELLRKELPSERLYVFPLIMDIRGSEKPFCERRDIVFVGGYQHAPNIDAVQYFVAEVMPLLRQQLPGVRFYAVGSKAPSEILALAAEDVVITGFVEDLNPLLDKMRVSVAPLRYGAGIKGKIGTAMANGLPVVATSLATEGMSLANGEHILVADGAEAFAVAVTRLYEDKALWERLSKNGLDFAEKAWGAEAAWGRLAGIIFDLGMNAIRGAHPLALYSEFESTETKTTNSPTLNPIASVKSRGEFEQLLHSDSIKQISMIENRLLDSANTEAFTVDGFCAPCDKKVSFLVDMQSGGQRHESGWLPNWRERLECPLCRMNNRQRLIATLISQYLQALNSSATNVYFMEQVTPIYHWAQKAFPKHNIAGSEYLGHEYPGGAVVKGIRHEDVMDLSFENNSVDLIISNDVLEHVPTPAKAFAECARVLKSGGVLLATIPFHRNNDMSVARAKIVKGRLEHVLPPSYHGNPVSADGSLVFTDFGWDVLDSIRDSGFMDVGVEVYASKTHVHLGDGILVFRCTK